MFADRAKIYIRSGKGGDGHCSFRRELYVPNGGPDGGDGGRGGDLIFEVDEGLNTLSDYRHRRKYAAGDGEPGGKAQMPRQRRQRISFCMYRKAPSSKRQSSGKVIADMSGENRRQVVLKGGKGGLGNQHFATATMQVPKYAQPGQPARELEVNLELKVIADVGLIGFPNVGKIHPPFQSDKRRAEDRQLSLHHAQPEPRRRGPGRCKGICNGGHSRADRRCFRGRRTGT